MKSLIWLSGKIWGRNWTFVWALLPWLVVLITLAIYKSKVLDVLRLGDPIAIGVGVQRKGTQAFIAEFSRIGRCMRFGGRRPYILRLIAPHIASRLVGGRRAN
ncbi:MULTISPECIES: iron chelate uptake ABC transporter family permease subunit [unclassified Bacillus (in: firmicutes)]|nr:MULTISPECIES: iron chelate uptake ABC transporter family permease subunit [unclassified Bacillus (in: firmicutes)]MBT2617013.1 iron chelate uptake ABC transporter family permease subunit [Bacillus sp. ISL-78]MBT2630506.1 iron chelate uptake ABC transporter family permease subunit [Bacillus sp. ISL-101]MBT2716505.1 iron chelate uptake ABC transporter family permease subunit [Bacillus sp. ISL-57]